MHTISFHKHSAIMVVIACVGVIGIAFFGGILLKRPIVMCNHTEPFEVPVSGGGMMLIVPSQFYAVQIQDKFKRNYVRPNEGEEG